MCIFFIGYSDRLFLHIFLRHTKLNEFGDIKFEQKVWFELNFFCFLINHVVNLSTLFSSLPIHQSPLENRQTIQTEEQSAAETIVV